MLNLKKLKRLGNKNTNLIWLTRMSRESCKRLVLHENVGLWSFVCSLDWWSDLPENKRELDLGVMELLGALSLAQTCRDCSGLDDLNAREPHSMARSHLSVHLLHRTVESGVTELLVHVVVPSSALVTQPDTVVLDLRGALLENLQEKKPQKS